MRRLVPWVLLGVLTVGALIGMGIALANQQDISAQTQSGSSSIPNGWKTYTYGHAAISVPSNWVVKRNSDCPDARAPGTMLLGLPKVPQFCPLIPMSANYLEIVNAPDSNPKQVEKVNGITVGIGFGAPSMITWTAPSLGIDIIGHGAITRRIVQTLQPR